MSDQRKVAAGDQDITRSELPSAISEASGHLAREAMDTLMRGRLEGGSPQHQNSTERPQDGSGSSRLREPQDGSGSSRLRDGGRESRQEENRASDKLSDVLRKTRYDLVVRPTEDGITDLQTGDKLVKDGNREILFMPNGDKLTVNKDGSYNLKSKGPVEVEKKGDTTTITYPNGDKVSFGKNGVESVSRGNVTSEILEPKMRNELKPIPFPEPHPFPQPNPPWDGPHRQIQPDRENRPWKRPE